MDRNNPNYNSYKQLFKKAYGVKFQDVDLASERALVEVQFSLPVDCSGSCLQSAGVAFTPNTGFDEFGGAAGTLARSYALALGRCSMPM